MLLANSISKFLINGNWALTNESGEFSNPPWWILIFLVVPLIKVQLFSKDLITFVLS